MSNDDELEEMANEQAQLAQAEHVKSILGLKRPRASFNSGMTLDDGDDVDIVEEEDIFNFDDEGDMPQGGGKGKRSGGGGKKQKTGDDAKKRVVEFIPTRLYTDILEDKLAKEFEKEEAPVLDASGRTRALPTISTIDTDDKLLEEIRAEEDDALGLTAINAETRRAVQKSGHTCKVCRVGDSFKTGKNGDAKAETAYSKALDLYGDHVLNMNKFDLYRAIALKFNEGCVVYDKLTNKTGIEPWTGADVQRHFEHRFDIMGNLQREIQATHNDMEQCRRTLWGQYKIDGVLQKEKVVSDNAIKAYEKFYKMNTNMVKMYTALESMGYRIGGPRLSGGMGAGGGGGVLKIQQPAHGRGKSVHSQAANASVGPPQDPMLNSFSGGKSRKSGKVSLMDYSDPTFM